MVIKAKYKNLLRTLLLSIAIVFQLNFYAQKNTITAGGKGSGAGGEISYSIGQIEYSTITAGNYTITQGLQQPYEINVTMGQEFTNIDLFAKIYPNPTTNFITLQIADFAAYNYSFQLLDEKGSVLKTLDVLTNETVIDINILHAGLYLLAVFRNGTEIKIYKIVKNE